MSKDLMVVDDHKMEGVMLNSNGDLVIRKAE